MDKVTMQKVEKLIYVIRGQKVMLDSDLANLYQVEVRALNQTVKRNLARFPHDFMFQINNKERDILRSQFVIFKMATKKRRYLPYVFTEQGIAMLSSILKSNRAIQVNISIMRTFVKIRHILSSDETLSERLGKLEKGTNQLFRVVFERLDSLEVNSPTLPAKKKN